MNFSCLSGAEDVESSQTNADSFDEENFTYTAGKAAQFCERETNDQTKDESKDAKTESSESKNSECDADTDKKSVKESDAEPVKNPQCYW